MYIDLSMRRMRDSNPHRLAPGGFQDRCNTNYANPPTAFLRATNIIVLL